MSDQASHYTGSLSSPTKSFGCEQRNFAADKAHRFSGAIKADDDDGELLLPCEMLVQTLEQMIHS